MARNNMTWIVVIVILGAYIMLPGFKESIDNILNPSSTGGETVMACQIIESELMVGPLRPGAYILVNQQNVGLQERDTYTVSPGDAIEASVEGGIYDSMFAPCRPSFTFPEYPQTINTSNDSAVVEDPFALDYGTGDTILPELDNTSYDFENLDDLNLDI